jgi:hypothetical protein
MNRRHFVAAAATAPLAGCGRLTDSDDDSRLDLTVHNERAAPITVRVEVVDEAGTAYADESDRIESGVAREFGVAVGAAGRHEVTVAGSDWQGTLAWDADTCALFEGRVGVTDEGIEVAGECVQRR